MEIEDSVKETEINTVYMQVVHFAGKNFANFAFQKKLYTENKKFYGSHLIFDQFTKF